MAGQCCDERGCTRRQPLLLLPSGLIPGRWYVLTRYTCEERDGRARVESQQKHALDEKTSATLTRWREAADVLAELVRLKDGPRDDTYRETKDAAWGRARKLVQAMGPSDG